MGLKKKIEGLATKEEVKEIATKCDKLEQYTRDRTHDTINAVNVVQVNMEKMRVEFIKEMRLAIQPLEDRLNEILLDRVDGGHGPKKRGG